MKHKYCGLVLPVAAVTFLLLTGTAGAVDYTVSGVEAPEYYSATDYADRYGAEYNYGGQNAADYESVELPYGVSSLAQIGAMEKNKTPGTPDVSAGGSVTGAIPVIPEFPSTWVPTVIDRIQFTDAATLERADGSIGTLKIPRIDINMKVYEGETAQSMKKGVGHFTSTSGWDGNIGICGHNRGAPYIIGNIKNLRIGDTIQYSTRLGSRCEFSR